MTGQFGMDFWTLFFSAVPGIFLGLLMAAAIVGVGKKLFPDFMSSPTGKTLDFPIVVICWIAGTLIIAQLFGPQIVVIAVVIGIIAVVVVSVMAMF